MDTATLDQFRYLVEQTIDDKKPEDWGSYNLGMATSINYFLQHQVNEKMKTYTAGRLPPLEKKVVAFLAKNPRKTPTEIAQNIDIENRRQISNLLRSLRAKQLISFIEIGKNRWYDVTQAGKQAYEQFVAAEESSVDSASENK